MKSDNSSSDGNSRTSADSAEPKILLVGDVSKAFLDADAALEKRCDVCRNMPDAIDAAAKNDFAAIAVVMSGIPARLGSALKALRDNCDAKVVLLAQMYEEPIAVQLVGSAYNGTSLADDYLICPVQPGNFCESIMAGPSKKTAAIPLPPAVDATTETRMRHLERLATEDDLTGLKNRRYTWEFCRQIIERAREEEGRVTLLVFDIDNFKHYNDVYGHSAGDEILKQTAVLVQRCCRGHDVVGRIGGDEFAVVFWDDPSIRESSDLRDTKKDRRSATAEHPTEAISIARRFVKELEKAELPTFAGLGPEGQGVLTISGGLASFPRDGSTAQELFEQADKALLEAKHSGKNRIYLVGKPRSDIAAME